MIAQLKVSTEEINEAILASIEAIPEIDDGTKFRERVKAVHGWVQGSEQPDVNPDIQAQCFYGLAFLTATQWVDRKHDDSQIRYKRLYFRQAVHCGRFESNPPQEIARVIDACMEAAGLDPRYDWQTEGKEVVTTWAPGANTLFMPLAAAVNGSIRVFFEMPDRDAATAKDLADWSVDVNTYAGLIGLQMLSPFHGKKIGRILGCYRRYAEQLKLDTVLETLHGVEKIIGIAIPRIEDPEDEVKQLEIEAGMRSAITPKSSKNWRENRKARRRKRSRR